MNEIAPPRQLRRYAADYSILDLPSGTRNLSGQLQLNAERRRHLVSEFH